MVQTILLALVAGIIIGPLARLVLPGRQNISLVMTVVLGAVGALAGSWIYALISGKTDTNGIDWISFAIGVIVAAIAIVVYGMLTGRESTGSSGRHPIT